MAFTLINSTSQIGTSSGCTTAAINTTGATVFVIVVPYSSGGTPAVSDSVGNVYTGATAWGSPASLRVRVFYCLSGTANAAHTATVSGASTFAPLGFFALSAGGTPTVDSGSDLGTGAASGTSITPGTFTPSANGAFIVTGLCLAGTASPGAPSGYSTLTAQGFSGGASEGGYWAYKIQLSIASESPTWTFGSVANASSMLVLIPPAGGTASLRYNSLLNGLGGSGSNFRNPLG